MKIYIVNQNYYPEVASTGQVFQEIAESYVRAGHEVKVIAGLPFSKERKQYVRKAHLNGVEVIRLWNTSFEKKSYVGRVINFLTFQLNLLGYMVFHIKKDSLVIVGTTPPMGIVCGALGKVLRGYTTVGIIQDLYPDILVCSGMMGETHGLYKVLKKIMKWSFKQCQHMVTISHDMKVHIQGAYGVSSIEVIPNMVPGEIFPIQNEKLKEAEGFKDKLVVMYSGNFGVAHEYKTLLATIRQLKDEAGIVFYIVGDGVNYRALKKACLDEKLANVVFKPHVDKEKLNENLNIGDLHLIVFDSEYREVLLPSKYYGILACGKPMILISEANNDIARDLKDYGLGHQINKGESDTFTNLLLSLKQNPEKLKAMSEQAQSVYETHYKKEIILERYLEMVESL